MIANACFHRGRDAQRLVNAAEVVVHEVERERVLVVFHFLRECIRQASEPAHGHSHREVLALDVTCGNVFAVGPSGNDRGDCADALCRAVAGFLIARIASVKFDQHGVINLSSECEIDSGHIGPVTVRRQLDAVSEPSRHVIHEMLRVPCGTPSDAPRDNELAISTERGPRPHIAVSKVSALFCGYVLILRVAKRPNFVALNSFARKVAKCLALIFRARRANPREELDDGILRNARHSHRGTYRITFDKSGNHSDLAFDWEVVHAPNYA